DPKDYKFYLSEDKTYCSIKKINKILLNNTELCNHMVDLYHKMALLKEKLDALIKEGKTYYKDYKIIGEISFFIDNPIEIEGMKTYDNATCDWKLVFDEKPIPEIVEALDFWENHNKNDLYFPQSFICRATHDFIYPKKKLLNINCNYIPYEVFENASSKNFYHNITLLIAKYPVPVKQLNKNPEEYLRYSNYYKERNLHRNLFWFEKKKILKIARRMLEYEFEINSTGNKIKKELEEFSKTSFPDTDEFFFEQRLNYKFCHPFGIITKKDAMYSKYVDSMLNISLSSMGYTGYGKKDNYSDNWLEFFWDLPYCKYHLCYTNHNLFDHCNLGMKDILKMNLKKFSPCYEISWVFWENDEQDEQDETEEV
ncbi:MAG: hypothetical protein IKZ04_03455, partial [Spirochaetaceae bacterium]|nr:hypothetical protein [Spirochaetaceae bacterium]